MAKRHNRRTTFALALAAAATLSITHALAVITTTGSHSNFDHTTAWDCGCVPDLTFWDGSKDANVQHNLTKTGNLTITNTNVLTVFSGKTLTINGDLMLGNNGSITVNSGGILVVTGKITTGSGSKLTNNGTINLTGNFEMATSATVHDLGGIFNVGGNFVGIGNVSAIVRGEVNITGTLDLSANATMSGSEGIVTWGSYSIFSCGFSYIYCDGNPRGNGCGTTNPPANGLMMADCSAPSVLPVELLNFHAGCLKEDLMAFHWTTLTESDNDYFSLEFSSNGKAFSPFRIIQGAGNSNAPLNYSVHWDYSGPLPLYVRLKQTDLNGNYTYSGMLAVQPCEYPDKLNILNNGTVDGARMAAEVFVPDNSAIDLLLFDAAGRLIHRYHHANLGSGNYMFPMQSLPPGAYVLQVILPYRTYSEKLIVR